jgi:hypothetical protein
MLNVLKVSKSNKLFQSANLRISDLRTLFANLRSCLQFRGIMGVQIYVSMYTNWASFFIVHLLSRKGFAFLSKPLPPSPPHLTLNNNAVGGMV